MTQSGDKNNPVVPFQGFPNGTTKNGDLWIFLQYNRLAITDAFFSGNAIC